MWDIFKKKYGGDGKVKRVKLQIYRMYFESLKMNEHGDVAKLFLRVDEIVYTMKGLDEKIKEAIIVQKLLRSLLTRFNPKVSVIEEMVEFKI